MELGLRHLDRLVKTFRFLLCLLWFVVGPGGLREGPKAPGRPTESSVGPPGGFRSPRGRGKNTYWFCRALLSGPGTEIRVYSGPPGTRVYPGPGYTRVPGLRDLQCPRLAQLAGLSHRVWGREVASELVDGVASRFVLQHVPSSPLPKRTRYGIQELRVLPRRPWRKLRASTSGS